MMYKSFKHQKTSISTSTLQLKKHGYIRVSLLFQNISKCPLLSLSLSLSLFGDSRSGSRVFLHHVSTTPIPHGNHTVLSKSNSSLGFELHGELKMMQAVVLIGGG
ncbi:hypothetical protein HanHA300_Chr13g0492201 [Helianthus annuus]|nr:hypothetical protein HanHA300_Chr13g0492201 [Helianthus annuus]KAJ0482325.1 hypothetical protein HanIR_Chr13g0652661 [Helianthus annuus]KAJ0498584.1 hypothetical protein HanHA89_Chr13g0524321 [Helianthus annuus]KAJ0664598.1 hypothetical protein HanLR1_Chr13g0494311 [Helianthus annuus]KAJ0672049.1 hypothetical protein HanOQP8_Chr13g0492641 [Helianthus annuus]